jgi:hypothetical protein
MHVSPDLDHVRLDFFDFAVDVGGRLSVYTNRVQSQAEQDGRRQEKFEEFLYNHALILDRETPKVNFAPPCPKPKNLLV